MAEQAGEAASQSPYYVVALRAASAFRFLPGESLAVRAYPSRSGPVDLTYRTLYQDEGLGAPIPRGLWVDARGRASSIDQAVESFSSAATELATILTISANAPAAPTEADIAYDATPGLQRREFYQRFIAAEQDLPRNSISIDTQATLRLLQATFAVEPPEAQIRLMRSYSEYRQALQHIAPGQEALALLYLYMAMRTVAPTILEEFRTTLGMNRASLLKEWNTTPKRLRDEAVARFFFERREDYERVRLIFDNFVEGEVTIRQAPQAAATLVRDVATSARRFLVSLARPGQEVADVLLGSKYESPVEWWPISRVIRGHLVGAGENPAAQSQEYPYLAWRSTIRSMNVAETGEYKADTTEEISPVLADGFSFEASAFQIYGPQSLNQSTAQLSATFQGREGTETRLDLEKRDTNDQN